jgi:tRNA(Ile)-lysidine synthase
VSAADAAPVSAAEAKALFAGYAHAPALVLAVSGGPDSTALLVLAARWRAALKRGPQLLAVTIDHGLRPQSAGEARAVKRLSARLGVRHRTLHWTGPKPSTGLPEAARTIRYRLLAAAARGAGAAHILTGHTLDDQAETVLIRMARGSGSTGLCAMARETPLEGLTLVRPLLDLPKARLIGTLEAIGMAFADDASNRDPRFTRARLRGLMPALAGEGLDARRLALLAQRLRRVEATIEYAVDAAAAAVTAVAEEGAWTRGGAIVLAAEKFVRLPAEVALRLLGRALALAGNEGPVQLGKLEVLCQALENASKGPAPVHLRRTLAGALVTLTAERLVIERAPPRSLQNRGRSTTLTKSKYGRKTLAKQR